MFKILIDVIISNHFHLLYLDRGQVRGVEGAWPLSCLKHMQPMNYRHKRMKHADAESFTILDFDDNIA